MDRMIFDYLEETFGISATREFYAQVDRWSAWRRGHLKSFHEFSETGASGMPVKRELYRLNMAKKVAEDWAAMLLGERTTVHASDGRTALWLTGADGAHGFLGSESFIRRTGALAEKAFALGTGAAILRLNGVLTGQGRILESPGASLSVSFVDAEHIVPISVENGEITEAAFISEVKRRGRELVYIELHRLGEDGYVITNQWTERRDGRLMPAEGDARVAGQIRTGSYTPLFAVLRPNLTNHIDELCGMGVSVYAQAEDCLKGVDLAFNNFCRDLKLGGKKVFLNRSLVVRDDRGTVYTPDDVAQQLFVTVGDGDLSEEMMIREHNPELRTEENADAVQHQLDYLSFRCGLGTRHYLFSGVQGKAQLTATQYTGEKQDLIQNTAHHRANVEKFILSHVKSALWAAKNVLCLPVDDSCELTVDFDDSYLIDSETERERDRCEVDSGLMKPYEYRMKWRGESEARAREMTGEALL